jgi:hypothetical protein
MTRCISSHENGKIFAMIASIESVGSASTIHDCHKGPSAVA